MERQMHKQRWDAGIRRDNGLDPSFPCEPSLLSLWGLVMGLGGCGREGSAEGIAQMMELPTGGSPASPH